MVHFKLCVPLKVVCVMKSPRVQVSIPPSAFESLKRFCQLSEQSMSGYLADLVVASMPILDALSQNLAAAKTLKYNAETLSVSPFAGVEKQLSEAVDNALKVLADEAIPHTFPRPCSGVGGGVGHGENHSAPLSLTGGLGKTKNDQQPTCGSKNKHIWLAASNEGVE